MNETISTLETFETVATLQSFRGAAEQLRTSPATISRKIAALERSVGVQLILRTTRKLALTEAGEQLFEDIRRPLGRLRAATRQASALRDEMAGLVRLTTTYTVAETLVLPIIPEIHKTYPELRIELHLAESIVDIRDHQFDLAVRLGELRDPTLIARKIGSDCIAFYSAPEAGKSPPILSYGDREFEPAKPVLRTRDMRMLHQLVRRGFGGAWLPDGLCREDLATGLLQRDGQREVFEFDAYLVYHANRFMPRRTQYVMDQIIAQAKRQDARK